MKFYTLFFALIFVFIPQFFHAQCPPPNFPQPGNSCVTAPILCPDLDGYCATINNSNTVQTFPGCPGWQLNNDEWFAFFAGTTQISIQITPSNCSAGGQQGLQGGIYGGCGPNWQQMDLQCSCTTSPFVLESSSFVVGQIYYIVLDGCSGNVCDYAVDVLSGSTVSFPPNPPGPITGPTTVCAGTNSNYSIPIPTGATQYSWTMTPSLGTITGTNQNASVSWASGAGGTTQLCVDVSNLCYPMSGTPAPACTTITVIPTPTATLSGTGNLCAGAGGSVDLTVTFTGTGPWTFVYRINGVNQPPITTSSNPYTLTVNQPGTYSLFSVSTSNGAPANCVGTVSGSSTITQTTLASTVAVTNASCAASNGNVNLTPAGGTTPYTFVWSNGASTEDLANVPAGSYTVTVTSANGCTQTLTATVNDNAIPVNITGTATANTTCTGGNGGVNISVAAPPPAPYTYTWSNGASSEDLTDVPAGTYIVTVSAGGACTGTASFTVANNPSNPSLSATTTGTTCNLGNGAINLTVTNGVAPFTYSWSNGETTEDLNNIPAGSYTVTVTGTNGCTQTGTYNVTNTNPPINITGTTTPNTACTGGTGSVNITVAPAGTYTFNWSNGETTEDLTNVPNGTYTVTVSGAGTCSNTASFTVANTPTLPQLSATTTSTTCNLANGSINLTATGNAGPFTFAWSNGATTEDLTDVPAGSYTVTATGANGCTQTGTYTIANTNPPINVTGTTTPNTACTSANGSININVAPAGAYTFNWSNGATSEDLTDVPPGTYTVTVSGQGTCSATASFTITNTPSLPTLSAIPTGTTCNLGNGAINLTVANGLAPFTFAWSNGATTEDLSSIPAGSYTVTVTGANGCTQVGTYNVTNTNPPINVTGTVTPNTTCLAGNGSINVSVAPAGTYTYLWSSGETTEDLTNVPPGTYSITVTGQGTCTGSASFTVANNPNLPVLNALVTGTTCDLANGAINLSVSGGVAPFTYAWSNTSTTEDLTGLSAGSYSVTVTGANGCTAAATYTVNNNNPPINITAAITANTTCLPAGNGAINVTVTPGGTYTYLWSNGAITEDLTGLQPGSYTVTVSGGGSCTNQATFDVSANPNVPNILPNITPATCGSTNGAINVTVTGGVSPFTYNWSNGGTINQLSNIAPGDYVLTVTGANGCSSVATITVPSNNPAIGITGTVTPSTGCSGGNGGVNITVTPPNIAYVYLWSTGATTQDLTGLSPGTYTVTVTLGVTCSQEASFTVPDNPNQPSINPTVTASTCELNNGSINVSVTGGVAPYTYLWSTGATSTNITQVLAGTYQLTVTGNNGCSNETSITVGNNNPPINVTATTTPSTNCLNGNGGINVTVAPSFSYTYGWSSGQFTQDLVNVLPGNYTITVTGAGACSAVASFEVPGDPNFPWLTISISPATCGVNNGSIDITPSGGVPPYTYSWSNGATTQDINSLPPDLYVVTVTGANGCSSTEGGVVNTVPVAVTANGAVTNLTSCVSNNGAIALTVTPANVTVTWSNGATTTNLNNLAAGNYTVTVSAGGTCTATAAFVVADQRQNPVPATTVTAATCGLPNGSIDLDATGGTAPYTYLWSNGSSVEDQAALAAANYTVTVTSAVGCTATAAATVPNNLLTIDVQGVTVNNTSCVAPNGAIDLTTSPAGIYTYQWSNAATTPNVNGLAPGAYTVTVTQGVNCTATASFAISEAATAPNIAVSPAPSTCGLSNGAMTLSVSGGETPYSFNWSNGASSQDLSNLPPGNYAVTVSGANGCTTTASGAVVNNPLALNIAGAVTENTSCVQANGAIDVDVTPAGTYSYQWSSSATTQDLNSLAAGNYTVTVSLGDCMASSIFIVPNNTPNPVLAPAVTPSICGESNGAIDLGISNSAAPYTVVWSNGATSEDLTAILSGTYSVTATAANGCTSTAAINVPNNAANFGLGGQATALTNCLANNGAVDLVITPPGPYQILWSTGATAEDLSSLSPGTYTVSVSESGSCTATASFIVTDDRTWPLASQSVTPEICGLLNGNIDLSAVGGTPPYDFAWDNLATSEDLSQIAAGSYTVTVTDVNGCSVTTTANVPANTISFSLGGVTTTNTSCVQPNGAVDLTITPAGSNYGITWSNGASSEDLSALPPGAYAVTVSAGGTCTNVASFTVPTITLLPLLSGNVTPSFCTAPDGAVDLSVTGGEAPFTFVWSTGVSAEDLGQLVPGTYSVTATGANGCTATSEFTVVEDVTIPVITGTTTSLTSCAAANGAIDVTVSPNLVYDYTWSGGQSNPNLMNLPAGSYALTVSAGGSCIAEASFVVDDATVNPQVSGTPTDILCFGAATGTIVTSVDFGQPPLQYSWSVPVAAGANPADLPAGSYTVTVTDALGCTGSTSFTLGQPADNVLVNCQPTQVVTNPTATDGAATVAVSGGVPPYAVSWTPGGSQSNVPAGSLALDNLAQGTYAVAVTDANGCTTTCGFTIGIINCLTAVGEMADAPLSRCGPGCLTAGYDPTGQVLDPNDVLQFILHEGNGAQIVNELARSAQPTFCFDAATMNLGTTYYISAVVGNNDGSGNVVLTDFCTVIAAGTPIVFQPKPVVTAAVSGPLSCGNDQALLTASADLPGAAYAWSTTTGQLSGPTNGATATAIAAANYTVIATVNGCADTTAVAVTDITNNPQASVTASPDDILDCMINEIVLNGTIEGTLAANTIWLSNGQIFANGTVVPIDNPGTYEFVVLDTLTFCTDTAVIVIGEDQAYPPLFVNTPGQLTCLSPSVTLSGGSSLPGIVFVWATITGADTTVLAQGTSFTVSTPGTYYFIGRDPLNNCVNAEPVTVAANLALPVADAGAPFSIDCYGETASLNGTGSTGAPLLVYLWSTTDGNLVNGAATAEPTIDEPGTYTLRVTNPANGCTDTDVVTITPDDPVATATVQHPACVDEKGAIVIDQVTGAEPPLRYSIDGGQTYSLNNPIGGLEPGNYTVLIVDANGCSTTVQATVDAAEPLQIALESQVVIKLGDSYQILTQINIDSADLTAIRWTPAEGLNCDTCLNPVASPLNSTRYRLDISTGEGCDARSTILVLVERTGIYVPNIFTPNGDGENDVVMVFGDQRGIRRIRSFQIYSRWGERVFEGFNFQPNDPANGWNGRFLGKEMNPAVFVWYALVEFIDGEEVLFKGDVTLMR